MIRDFNDLKESGLMYGGQAGDKLGVIIDEENWFLKFPKSTKGMKRIDMSYTTSQLSEYLGSHIYEILGYDTHKTMLGFKDGILVVACKDFTSKDVHLYEFREIRNYYNKDLREKLELSLSSSDPLKHGDNLETIMIHLDNNPILKNIKGAKERFFDCIIIDGLINNNDRNSGNWGVLKNDISNNYTLAPVFDNGAAFSSKLSDRQMENILNDPLKFELSSLNITSGYYYKDKDMLYKNLVFDSGIKEIDEAIKRVAPIIENKLATIISFITNVPTDFNDLEIMSNARKEFYIKSLENRFNKIVNERFKSLV